MHIWPNRLKIGSGHGVHTGPVGESDPTTICSCAGSGQDSRTDFDISSTCAWRQMAGRVRAKARQASNAADRPHGPRAGSGLCKPLIIVVFIASCVFLFLWRLLLWLIYPRRL